MLLGLFCLQHWQWLSGAEQDSLYVLWLSNSKGSYYRTTHTTSHRYLASPLWDVKSFPSSPTQESCGRRNKVEKEVVSQDEKQRETPSTISLKSHELCLSFPSPNMIHKNQLCPHAWRVQTCHSICHHHWLFYKASETVACSLACHALQFLCTVWILCYLKYKS